MRDSSLPRFAARIGLAASDVAFPLVIALVLTLGFASPAYAYVDRDRLDRAESEARRMKAEQSSSKPETLCWRARFLFSLTASLMLIYTFAVVAPLEIVASSVNSLLFTVTDVWVPFAVFGLAGT